MILMIGLFLPAPCACCLRLDTLAFKSLHSSVAGYIQMPLHHRNDTVRICGRWVAVFITLRSLFRLLLSLFQGVRSFYTNCHDMEQRLPFLRHPRWRNVRRTRGGAASGEEAVSEADWGFRRGNLDQKKQLQKHDGYGMIKEPTIYSWI